MTVRTALIAAALLSLGSSLPAMAQEQTPESPPSTETPQAPPPTATPETVIVVPTAHRAAPLPNVGFEVGGGFQTFTGQLGDVTNGGASYGMRFVLGERSLLGVEFGYLGAWNEAESSETIDKTSANVYTNSGEALLRLNLFGKRSPLVPFVAGGANYTRIDATVGSPIGSFAIDGTEGIGFPMVAGLQFFPSPNFTLSARANYTFLSNFLDADLPSGNQWGGSVNVGAVF